MIDVTCWRFSELTASSNDRFALIAGLHPCKKSVRLVPKGDATLFIQSSHRLRAASLSELTLREFDCRNRPAPGMSPDGNSQAVVLVERDNFHRTRFSVAEDDGLADKFSLSLMERRG